MASSTEEGAHPLFLPFAPFAPLNPSEELPLSVGRPVLLLNKDESPDWWFGRDAEDGREGWFPANHGSIQDAAPQSPEPPTGVTTVAAVAAAIDPPLSPTPVAEEAAATFRLLNAASARFSVDLELPTPPTKPQWMLSPSPPEHTAAPTTPQAESTAEEGDGSTAGGVEGGEGEDNALAATTADITAVAGEQELSGIAKAMRELEEAACPKKRTMTRFSFLGGVKIEASPGRKPTITDDELPRPPQEQQQQQQQQQQQGVVVRGFLDKRPSYAERFSCLIGLEGSRAGDSGVSGTALAAGKGSSSGSSSNNVVPSFEGKGPLLRHLLGTEAAYVERLRGFKAAFIDPVEKRDTEDRRKLRALPKLAVGLELFVGIAEWNAELLRGLEGCCCVVQQQQTKNPRRLQRAATGAGDACSSPSQQQPGGGGDDGEGVGFDIPRLAELLARAAPGLRLYATYAANHAGALHDLHTAPSALNRCLKAAPLPPTLLSLDGSKPLTVERALSLPCLRFPQYQQYLAELMTFISQDDPAFESLCRAYQLVNEETRAAAASLREQEHQLELLKLQQCFLGHVEVFAPRRRLLLEGWVHKVKFNKHEKRVEEQTYMHLFTDALTYSTRFLNGTYQLRQVVNLRECQDLVVYDDCWGYPTECELITKRCTNRLRVGDVAWVKAIQAHIARCREEELLAQMHQGQQPPPPHTPLPTDAAAIVADLKSPVVAGLDRRGKILGYMVASEATYLGYLRTATQVVIAPLDDVARGAGRVLGGGGEEGEEDWDAGERRGIKGDERAQGLFESKVSLLAQLTEGRRARGQIKAQEKLLGTPDMLIFLKAYPQLEIVTAGLVAALQQRLARAQEQTKARPSPSSSSSSSSSLMVADAFLGVIKPLAAAYASYAGSYEEASRILLARPEFTALASSAAVAAKLAPLTLAQHLHAPFDAMQRYETQLQALLEATEKGHPDNGPLLEALALVRDIKARMDKTLDDARMFRRIQAIRDSILVLTPPLMGKPDSLASLVSTERRLLKEGTLLKACRAKDKAFYFWLFDDSLLYCSPLPASHKHRYQFHRRLSLAECQIRESRTDAHALELLSPTKSFALRAASPHEAREWTAALRAAISQARAAHGLPPSPGGDLQPSQQMAPLWVQEGDAPSCRLCRQPFAGQWLIGSGQRRFHCRACGQCVCGPCSGYRMKLSNLHLTRKQRVCAACFKGGKPCLGIEDVSHSGGAQHPRASSLSSAASSTTVAHPLALAAVAATTKPPLPTLTKAKTAAAPAKPPRRASHQHQQPGAAAGPNPFDTTGGDGKGPNPFETTTRSAVAASAAAAGQWQRPSPSVGVAERSPNPFDHDDDDDSDGGSSVSSGDEATTPAQQQQQQRPPSLAPARRPPLPTRGLGGEMESPRPRGGMPLVGMAAVLAEMAAGGGKKELKKAAQEGASAAGTPGVTPPRGVRPTHGGLPTGPALLRAIQQATKGLRKVESPSPGTRGPPPPPPGSLLEELTEAMERRRKWLEDVEEGGKGGEEEGVVRMCVTGGGVGLLGEEAPRG